MVVAVSGIFVPVPDQWAAFPQLPVAVTFHELTVTEFCRSPVVMFDSRAPPRPDTDHAPW
jgi:hypothetical protein